MYKPNRIEPQSYDYTLATRSLVANDCATPFQEIRWNLESHVYSSKCTLANKYLVAYVLSQLDF